ncbi:MAG: hypothetical protein Q8M76_13380, partial [Spirochaetaceae bacterium]|nr:hypothetical protein [Spirochaetaceae bacterium]
MKRLIAIALIAVAAASLAFGQAKPKVMTSEPKVMADYFTPDVAKRGGTLTLRLSGSPQSWLFYGVIDNNAY